jgi:trk system potassium uptake protein TrkA
MKIVILGCGRVGARLAAMLEADGHQVNIIDSDPKAFERLPENFKGQTILGTGIDVDVLRSAGIESADAFAAVTNFDNTNIMACEVAKEIFGIEKVLARIYDPGRENLYHELGLETVCPTTLISTTARNILLAPPGTEILPIPPHTYEQQPAEAEALAAALSTDRAEARYPGTGAPSSPPPSAPTPTATPAQPPAQPRPAVPQAAPEQPEKPQHNGRGLRGFFRH